MLDVQADLLEALGTRVVVPLLPSEIAPPPARDLNPVSLVRGQPHVMLTQFLAAVPVRELKRRISVLDAHGDEIMRALDMLLVGF